MNAVQRPDPSRCPLCGESNRCALEIERETGQAQPACWCMEVDFSEDLLARVPEGQRRMACICARCAAQEALQE
ncbi:MAG TPA: cysteine-rich CWC family protein [Variovorax sp.]|nr:cysteine-rich CWC family protein [Variovorax sp.]